MPSKKGVVPPHLKDHLITKENAREYQKRGRIAHKKYTEERKQMKEALDLLLNKTLKSGKMVTIDEIENLADVENLNISAQTAIIVAMMQRAMLGDVQAAQFIRDTVGEKPNDKVEIDQSLTVETWAKNHKVKL